MFLQRPYDIVSFEVATFLKLISYLNCKVNVIAACLAGKKHCGDVCGCKRSRKVEGRDRLRLQQTRQLKKKKVNYKKPHRRKRSHPRAKEKIDAHFAVITITLPIGRPTACIDSRNVVGVKYVFF